MANSLQFNMIATLRVDITEEAQEGAPEAAKKLIEKRLKTPIFIANMQITLVKLEEVKPDE